MDFERTSHRKFYVKGEEYRRYHAGTLESAVDAGVDCFYVQPPGYLVLLHPPNAEKVKSDELWDLGHDDYDPRIERPEHRACNRAAANELKTSREW